MLTGAHRPSSSPPVAVPIDQPGGGLPLPDSRGVSQDRRVDPLRYGPQPPSKGRQVISSVTRVIAVAALAAGVLAANPAYTAYAASAPYTPEGVCGAGFTR